ncbi:hypothetical protein TBLA_0B03720 [Henningerozyma blattae CBS 6284]|uniref:mRNA export factor MEX67 n=1 Tax=Henningerozyma blattae (strain ATCC 34711 / CBS 6284 / DSM 70876 / NBRC 10599 / NRRL Y-10934 / UCD 77-7) TaxID=1071380 RepID=I2GYK9_HENB6|nr:hypothetical protein TBLA_0B03720 [Tetrapisispora blattae CBS 6284]CCH59211.1 hypothetical protein TBLA_0B03720 [Tetrapisispora blattae CBS 6284]
MNNNFHNNVNNLGMYAQQQQQMNRVKICVRNVQGLSMQQLLNFVSKNARVSLMDAKFEGNTIVGYVNNRQDAQLLNKWNGVRLGNCNLKFEIMDGQNSSPHTQSTIMMLKNFLYRRYNPQQKMLDLSSLHNDQELVQNGLFSSIATQSKMFPALMKVISQEPQLIIESVNLAGNNLKDIFGITTLAQTIPNLKNLCLANNQISAFKSMENWRNKFKELNELLMLNNPITNDRSYRTEMLRLFPKLVMLDNVVVRDAAKLKSVFSLPMQIQQFFFETSELGQSSLDFIKNFLNCWDTNRDQLLPLYTPQSSFSYAVDSSIPASTVPESDQHPSFGYYLSSSRNITKISSEKAVQQRLYMGQEAINNSFKSLPMTKHHLDDDPNGYSVQTISLSQLNGFMITLHGYFNETEKPLNTNNSNSKNSRNKKYSHGYSSSTNKLSKKSFDRSWVIAPANGGIVIASDLLTIRPYSSNSWSIPKPENPTSTTSNTPASGVNNIPTGIPGPQPPIINQQGMGNPLGMQGGINNTNQGINPLNNGLQPGMSATGPINAMNNQPGPISLAPTLQLPPNIQANLNPIQLDTLNKLHLQTKLNSEYTYMLAEQSGWNYDNALKSFQSSINNLPREAYIQ